MTCSSNATRAASVRSCACCAARCNCANSGVDDGVSLVSVTTASAYSRAAVAYASAKFRFTRQQVFGTTAVAGFMVGIKYSKQAKLVTEGYPTNVGFAKAYNYRSLQFPGSSQNHPCTLVLSAPGFLEAPHGSQ